VKFEKEVCCFFYEAMYAQQKVALFMGSGPCFFQKAGFEKIGMLFELVHGVYKVKT
jgi:hypothetical protein